MNGNDATLRKSAPRGGSDEPDSRQTRGQPLTLRRWLGINGCVWVGLALTAAFLQGWLGTGLTLQFYALVIGLIFTGISIFDNLWRR